jgi:competence protein ComEA
VDEPEGDHAPPPLSLADELRRVLDEPGVRRLLPVVLACAVALAGVVGAGAWWLSRPAPGPPTEEALPFATPSAPATTLPAVLYAHAAGAVIEPGLYELAAGARVADLLAAAGGPSRDADLDRVNLAALVGDGERVYVPAEGEAADPLPSASAGSAGAPAGPVDVNTADAATLESLPGIGPALAAAIVSFRDEHGPFATVDSLLEVPGIGPAKLDGLAEQAVAG